MAEFPLRRIPRPEGGTEYDEYPEHPLAGVPQAVLDVARSVLDQAVDLGDVPDRSEAHPIADAVVMRLKLEGYLRTSPSSDTPREEPPSGDGGLPG